MYVSRHKATYINMLEIVAMCISYLFSLGECIEETVINNSHVPILFNYSLQHRVLSFNPLKHMVTLKVSHGAHSGYVFCMILRINTDIFLYTLNRLFFTGDDACSL